MQAITTRFHGPTNTRGSRITAKADAGRLTVAWNHALSCEANHVAAAKALIAKLEWTNGRSFAFADSPDGKGYVFVPVGSWNVIGEVI